MRIAAVSVVLMCFALSSLGQKGAYRKSVYETISVNYHPRGLHFAPGITYMWPSEWKRDAEILLPGDTLLQANVDAAGKIGAYLEIGHAHFLPDYWWFEYIDYGLHFKMLRGKEQIKGELVDEDTRDLISTFERNSKFSESFVGAYINFNKFIPVGRNYLTVGAGFNGDYRIISNRESEPEIPLNDAFANELMVQAHAKLGYAIKLQENLFFIPALEVPVLTMVTYEKARTTMPYFNSYYRPIMLSLRFQWLTRKKPEDCVGKPDKKSGHQLWDSNMRKFRK